MQIEILIVGSGGQGIILMGKIIGTAATLNGMFSTQISTHGSSQRGIPVRTEIILSDKPVKFAFVQKPDYSIIMSYRGFDVFGRRMSEDTRVFIDSDNVKDFKLDYRGKFFSFPATTIAKEIGSPLGANFIMLGKFLSATEIIPLKMIEEAIKQNTPEPFIKKNLDAVKQGYTNQTQNILSD